MNLSMGQSKQLQMLKAGAEPIRPGFTVVDKPQVKNKNGMPFSCQKWMNCKAQRSISYRQLRHMRLILERDRRVCAGDKLMFKLEKG